MTFAVLLRDERERAGLTQAGLARRMGVSESMICRYEAGTIEPRLPMFRRFVGVFPVLAHYVVPTDVRIPRRPSHYRGLAS